MILYTSTREGEEVIVDNVDVVRTWSGTVGEIPEHLTDFDWPEKYDFLMKDDEFDSEAEFFEVYEKTRQYLAYWEDDRGTMNVLASHNPIFITNDSGRTIRTVR